MTCMRTLQPVCLLTTMPRQAVLSNWCHIDFACHHDLWLDCSLLSRVCTCLLVPAPPASETLTAQCRKSGAADQLARNWQDMCSAGT